MLHCYETTVNLQFVCLQFGNFKQFIKCQKEVRCQLHNWANKNYTVESNKMLCLRDTALNTVLDVNGSIWIISQNSGSQTLTMSSFQIMKWFICIKVCLAQIHSSENNKLKTCVLTTSLDKKEISRTFVTQRCCPPALATWIHVIGSEVFVFGRLVSYLHPDQIQDLEHARQSPVPQKYTPARGQCFKASWAALSPD